MTNNESLFASLHILMRAILMAQRTLAAGLADTGIEKAAAKSAPAGKNSVSSGSYKSLKICVNQCNLRNLRLINSCLYSLCLCAFLWLKNPFNQRNLRLIKDLRAYKTLYNCRETFTDVMSALQIRLFMQNKANFRKVKLNVNKVLTTDYDKMDTWSSRKTKPIQSQSKPIKANIMPEQTQFKPKQTQYAL